MAFDNNSTNNNTNNSSTQSQSLYADNQTYKIDIEKVYSSIVQEIDKIRSNVSVATNSAALINFLKSANTTHPQQKSVLSQTSVDPNNVQESRCHAFYRLIGLPVYEPAGTSYSPGINRESDKKASFKQFKKLVGAGISKDLYHLMDERENNVNNYLQIFSVSDINASVLALASTHTPLRKFGIILDAASQDPFNSDPAAQSYTFDNTFNSSFTALLTQYEDANGTVVSGGALQFLSKRSHIIAPFMVDPRVELTVNPPYTGSPTNNNTAICKIMGAPFATDKSQLCLVNTIYASRPIIETICRKRLNTAQPQSTLAARFQDIIKYVQNTDIVNDSKLLDEVFANPTQSSEDQVLLQYINVMRAMIDKLVEAIQTINDVEIKYHWVPIPNVKGPEFGSTTQGIILGDPLNMPTDIAIINGVVTNEISQINAQSTQVTQPDLGNFVDLQIGQPSPDTQTTNAMGDRAQNEVDDMIKMRNEKTSSANDTLRTIEIIMGEFSGLGLADIIAIYLALWTIDRDTLVGMLDTESFVRLTQFAELQDPAVKARQANNNMPTSGNDIVSVMTRFEKQVVQIYAIMDKLMLDRVNNNGSSSI